MKSVALVLVLIVLVAGVAVGGSRAQPLPRTSEVLRLCQPGLQLPPGCRPLVAPDNLAIDGDIRDFGDFAVDGGDDAGDKHWWDLAVRVALAVADWWASHGFRMADGARVDWSLFDPAE